MVARTQSTCRSWSGGGAWSWASGARGDLDQGRSRITPLGVVVLADVADVVLERGAEEGAESAAFLLELGDELALDDLVEEEALEQVLFVADADVSEGSPEVRDDGSPVEVVEGRDGRDAYGVGLVEGGL